MKLRISHITTYQYAQPVTDSVNEIRLTPVTNERQSCYNHTISVEPNAPLFAYEDSFGNRVHAFSVNQAHSHLTIRTSMTVVTTEAFQPEGKRKMQNLKPTEAWDQLQSDAIIDRFIEFLLPTAYTEATQEIIQFMNEVPSIGIVNDNAEEIVPIYSVYDWLKSLSNHIHMNFAYDPEATTVSTKAYELIEKQRGVCQDFAHLMIAICRAKGIPARYVSGYHFVGDLQGGTADFEQASHAWVEAYIPELGWYSFDPTNKTAFDDRYVKLGHGRDYIDIVPVKGIYRGTSEQKLVVTVDVQKFQTK
ncbi:transglutaminase family protein [Paenibacillus endoradicis]|uniref:transglutaminase family protein n=1 Tax=Paenibacillus endoradicis TaxID=2972487 RepID=UPI0021596AA7|nr:transglutaminase family protein [Paenibacillus endoradicis]MCR8657169.1 transglutaminase family protein [Paenibacillus endoradicis]